MQDFFACGSSAPVRVEHEGGAAAWLVGTTVVPSVQGHGLVLPQEVWPHQSFSVAPLVQALRGPPCLGSFSVVWLISHLKEHPG